MILQLHKHGVGVELHQCGRAFIRPMQYDYQFPVKNNRGLVRGDWLPILGVVPVGYAASTDAN